MRRKLRTAQGAIAHPVLIVQNSYGKKRPCTPCYDSGIFMNQKSAVVVFFAILIIVVAGISYWTLAQQRPSPVASPSPTACWKTYRSAAWGVAFDYPPNFVLNTSPSAFWKGFGPYVKGYDFFELVDSQRNCYLGPIKATDIRVPDSETSVAAADGTPLQVKYWFISDGGIYVGQASLLVPATGSSLYLNLTSLSNEVIESNSKKTAASLSVPESCVKDFEAILATVTFT